MRKVRALIAALLLLVGFAAGIHAFCLSHSLRQDNAVFKTWYNMHKNLSYKALSESLDPDDVLVMGSSEFRHGRNSKYHMANLFADSDVSIMTVGGPQNQTLYHAILLGALEPELKSRKAMLIISPTWFRGAGVGNHNYSLRFSATEYLKFMENERIPDDIKQYAAERSEDLLSKKMDLEWQAKIIDNKHVRGRSDIFSTLIYKAASVIAYDRDHLMTYISIRKNKAKGVFDRKAGKGSHDEFTDAYWEKLLVEAESNAHGKTEKKFGMSKKSWKKDFSKIEDREKGAHPRYIYEDSQEFGDLEAFLRVSKALGIRVKLLILPVNGKWYDHIGTGRERRVKTSERINKLAEEYGAETADLTDLDYEPYVLKDAMHPWDKGWVMIDEEIYKFCKE